MSSRELQRSPSWGRRRVLLGVLTAPFANRQAAGQVGAGGVVADTAARPGRVLAVGPKRTVQTLARAARLAADGDTVEVDAGEYVGDVAVWTQDRLTVRAVGGRALLRAAGRSAEGKAIWVVRGGTMRIEGIDFTGARVASRNGAGIRFERGQLVIDDCSFIDNENGILTASDPEAVLEIENSEFGHNGYGDGYSHNLYVGAIGMLTVTGCYFHHARVGHLLKSRAAQNHILYNRLTDETGGAASYELEFPNGGIAFVVGNIIAQGLRSENPLLVSYGAEGYLARPNVLTLVHNTLVDGVMTGGAFVFIRAGERRVLVANNLLVGDARFDTPAPGDYLNNFVAARGDFVAADDYDFRLVRGAAVAGKVATMAPVVDLGSVPQREYVHPRRTRSTASLALQPGAMQSLGS